MPMDGKLNFLDCLEEGLAEEIPAAMMTKVMKLAADALAGFEVTQVTEEERGDDELLKYYASVLSIEGRSQKTIDRYMYILNRMLKYVKMPTRKITVYHLRSYMAAEKERGIQDSTLEGYRMIFASYFNWLQREGMIDKNPTANLGIIKVAKKQKDIFTDVDMEKLARSCTCIRDRAIIAFLDSTACRISEMTELNREDIDFERKHVIVHGKGNKERMVFLTDVAAMLLKEYLDSRKDENEALFVSVRGAERLQPGGIRFMLKNLSEESGVAHVHPHKFRRTKATRLAQQTDLQIVQRLLGHEKPDTTMGYVMLNNRDLEDAFRRCV